MNTKSYWNKTTLDPKIKVRSNQNVINQTSICKQNMTHVENSLCCYDFDSVHFCKWELMIRIPVIMK